MNAYNNSTEVLVSGITWPNLKSHELQEYINTLGVQSSVGVENNHISNFSSLKGLYLLAETTAVLF